MYKAGNIDQLQFVQMQLGEEQAKRAYPEEKFQVIHRKNNHLTSHRAIGRAVNITTNMFEFQSANFEIHQYNVVFSPPQELKLKRDALIEELKRVKEFAVGCVWAYDGDARLVTSHQLDFERAERFDVEYRG